MLDAVISRTLYRGTDAIERVRQIASASLDSGASSHWRDRLSDFKVEAGAPTGYRGFGLRVPTGLHRQVLHYLMQTPYRLGARTIPDFKRFDSVLRQIARQQGRAYDYNVIRQAFTPAVCAPHFKDMEPGSWHYVIGDGYGTVTSLLLRGVTESRVALANLAPVLLVDLIEVASVGVPLEQIALAEDQAAAKEAAADPSIRVIAVTADNHQALRPLKIGFVYNTASFGEMNPETVRGYFDDMRAFPCKTFLYNANRASKTLPDGTTSRFNEYPWMDGDRIIFEGEPFWYRYFYYYAPYPHYIRMTEPVLHRLCELAKP